MGRLTDARRRARRAAETPAPADAAAPASDVSAPPPADPLTAESPATAAGDAIATPVDGAADAAAVFTETPAAAELAGANISEPGAAGEVEAHPGETSPIAETLHERAPDTAPHDATPSERAPADGDTLVFADDEMRRPARYVLPSSGLAEDILAAAESGAAAAGDTALAEVAPAAEIAPRAARTHQFTFFAAPEREAREQVEATEHLVTFLVGGEEYGVDVRLVQEIIRVPAVTAVPRAPVFVRGVVNLRGRIIPVIDLKTKLGLGRVDAAQRRARVVVVRLKGRLVGLLVDGASQVLKVPVSVIEAAPEEVVEVESHFLRGVAKLGGRLIILVDLLEVLAPELRADGAAP